MKPLVHKIFWKVFASVLVWIFSTCTLPNYWKNWADKQDPFSWTKVSKNSFDEEDDNNDDDKTNIYQGLTVHQVIC